MKRRELEWRGWGSIAQWAMGPFDIPSPKGSRLVLSRRVPIWNFGEGPERIAVFLERVARSFFNGGAEFFAIFVS